MSEHNDRKKQNETLQKSKEKSDNSETIWEPVQNEQEFNDYPLAFVNVDKETDEVTYNVDGEDVKPENLDSPGPMIVGEFQGIKDISSDNNPEPSIKVLIDSDDDERTYALNKVNALESQLENIENGDKIGIDFEGYVHPEDGLPWQNWRVYTPGA